LSAANNSADAKQRAARIAHDAAVARGILQPRGEHGGTGALCAVILDKAADGVRTQARHVAVEHHDRPRMRRELRFRLHDSMAGSQLLHLAHELDPRARARRLHALGLITRHQDYRPRANQLHRVDHVQHHGAAAHGVQHLGQVGLHALALAGGQNHRGEGRGLGRR
jgi:hypothetical protein